jgi:hypothetical protein
MKASIAGIYDRGILDKERVHFRADTDLNLSFYVLLDSFWKPPNQVSAGNVSGYWFPPATIPRGEHFVVYTRSGSPNRESREDGSIFHFLFRGLARPLYENPHSCAVLVEAVTWDTTKVISAPLSPLPPAAPLSSLFGQPGASLGSTGIGGTNTLGSLFGSYKPGS